MGLNTSSAPDSSFLLSHNQGDIDDGSWTELPDLSFILAQPQLLRKFRE